MPTPAPSASRPAPLRRLFRALALLVLIVAAGYWAAKGAHTGWSMHRVPVSQLDEITGIEYVIYEERFVPGIEWLGAGLGLAGLLFGTSFFFRSKITQTIK